jgi:membrane carboxypeptidase/penicillin-binding protein PbpC
MVLDLPPDPARSYAAYHGPVRMRIALANALPGALQATLQVADPAHVLSVAGQMGLQELPQTEADYAAGIAAGRSPASLLDMTYAYSVLSNDGTMMGASVPAARIRPGYRELDPSVLLSIQDGSNASRVSYEPEAQAVLSPSLAYLVGDVLRDATARLSAGSSVSALDPGRQAAVIDGPSAGEELHWTLGYSPPIVVGVWFRAAPEGALAGVDAYNGPAAVWKAVLQYATRDLPARGFPAPAGIVELDVCDPSGLLPTPYCPKVVHEVFAQGTEPVHYDHLFRPFRVNRETGKLATLFTPLDLVEERIFLIPPPEAEAWAQAVGFPSPPAEYDPLPEHLPFDGDVNLARPTVLEILHGRVVIRGDADIPDQASFRLQFGEGLNPTRWISIADQRSDLVRDGPLGEWDTSGLNGLVTLQLVAVDRSGSVRTAAVPVILDNQPPVVHVVLPQAEQSFDPTAAQLVLEAFAHDETGVTRVEFLIDGARVADLTQAPYSVRISLPRPGEHRLVVRASDAAGNVAESEPVAFQVGD